MPKYKFIVSQKFDYIGNSSDFCENTEKYFHNSPRVPVC